ncbi:hypothetical protein T484DRAFT_1813586 [Baffinella frigidus]|nr:hypothetical protein T484DRAFT_1813586 [Cryptophyta sp. CCMP2293]
MPVDLAMVGRKRGREEHSDQGVSGGSAGASKRALAGAKGKRVFECTFCGKAFSQSSDLTKHMRTHSGDRPYPCTTCDMAFSQYGSLTRHMRTHSGDRPYPCTTCGMTFSTSSNLTVHMRTHTGDRPYVYVHHLRPGLLEALPLGAEGVLSAASPEAQPR